ncbi:MAG: hypothetical protein ACK5NT_08860 [Pyrinomonadaceae bacterium]
MKSSWLNKIGLTTLIVMIALVGSSCIYYKKVMARKNLVDGAQAYNQRQFDTAIKDFNKAVSYDPDGTTLESRSAQLFLARTLHSIYAGNRRDTSKAQEAIAAYQKALPEYQRAAVEEKADLDKNPGNTKLQGTYQNTKDALSSIISAVASLYENLQQEDKWLAWEKAAAENADLPNDIRANSYVALAAKDYTCASDITDSDDVKKTVTEGGEQVYKFTKPADEQTFAQLKKCVDEGLGYAKQAVKLDENSDSAWSYMASLLVQAMRVAEMEGNAEQADSLKKQSEESKTKFEKLAEIKRKKEEAEAAQKAKEAGGENKAGGDSSDQGGNTSEANK